MCTHAITSACAVVSTRLEHVRVGICMWLQVLSWSCDNNNHHICSMQKFTCVLVLTQLPYISCNAITTLCIVHGLLI